MASHWVLFGLVLVLLSRWWITRSRPPGRFPGTWSTEVSIAGLAVLGAAFGLVTVATLDAPVRLWSWAFLDVAVLTAFWLAQRRLPQTRVDRWTMLPSLVLVLGAFPLLDSGGGRAANRAGLALLGAALVLFVVWVVPTHRSMKRSLALIDAHAALLPPLDVQFEFPDSGVVPVSCLRVVAGPYQDLTPFDHSGQLWYVTGPPGEPIPTGARLTARRLGYGAQLRPWFNVEHVSPGVHAQVWAHPDAALFDRWAAELAARQALVRAAGYEAMGAPNPDGRPTDQPAAPPAAS